MKTAKSFYYDERYYSFIRAEGTRNQDPPDLVVSVPQIPQVGIFAQAGPSGMSKRPVQKSDNQSTEAKKPDSDVSSPPQSPEETGADKMTEAASDAETGVDKVTEAASNAAVEMSPTAVSPPKSQAETQGSSASQVEIADQGVKMTETRSHAVIDMSDGSSRASSDYR